MLLFALFVLQFVADWILYYRTRYFYFVVVVLSNTVHLLLLNHIYTLAENGDGLEGGYSNPTILQSNNKISG